MGEISGGILPILQTGSAGLAFLFGLMGLWVVRDWSKSHKPAQEAAADIPQRLFSFMILWLIGTLLMFSASTYVQFVVKPVTTRLSISPSNLMARENMTVDITVGSGKAIRLPRAKKEAEGKAEAHDRATVTIGGNSQIDISIEQVTDRLQELKKTSGAFVAANRSQDQGSSD